MELRETLSNWEMVFPKFAKCHINDAYALLSSGEYITGI